MAEQCVPMADLHDVPTTEGSKVTGTMKDEPMTTVSAESDCVSECSFTSRSEEDIARSTLEVEADAFTRFIDRQRVEVMFELRNLRLGERPVTGQPNRERIETFLNDIREQRDQRTPSARPAAPSAHIADINALATRRCVSAALGSVAFRQDLENAIRRSIELRPATLTPRIPVAPPLPQTFVPAPVEPQQPRMTLTIPASPTPVSPVTREQARARHTLPRTHEPLNLQRQEREFQAWQTITQLQQEMIVIEISDLVHRQLVSSALESDFRSHLEQNILNRLAQGAPAQQPATTAAAPRIQPTPSPARAPMHTSVTSSTVTELYTRLDSMQHMLQLMYSMQLDMQRSLRQEVASSLANVSSMTAPSPSQPVNAGHCTICLTAVVDTVLYRCGHLCVCYTCGLNLRETSSTTRMKCPICRAPVDDILRVYRSSRDGE